VLGGAGEVHGSDGEVNDPHPFLKSKARNKKTTMSDVSKLGALNYGEIEKKTTMSKLFKSGRS
jgi:hypothetical protein